MKKLNVFLVIAIISSLILTACGSGKSAEGSKEKTLASIKEKGVLVVGTSPDYPPFEFISNGEVVGLDPSFAKYITEDLGVKLEIKQMDFNNLLNALSTGMVDVVMAGMNPSEEKKQSAAFTDIYFETTLATLVRADDDSVKTESDLEGKSLGVQFGTTQETYAKEVKGAEVVSLTSNPDIVMNIKAKKIDAGLMEKQVAESFVKTNPDLKVIEDFIIREDTGGIAIATQKENEELVKALNEIIKKANSEGLMDQWFLEAQELSQENIK